MWWLLWHLWTWTSQGDSFSRVSSFPQNWANFSPGRNIMLLLRGSNWMCCLIKQEKFLGRKTKIFMKTSLLSLWISLTWVSPCSQYPSEIDLARWQQRSFQTVSLKLGRRAPCGLEAVVPVTRFLRSTRMQARQSESAACLQTPTSWESYLVLLSQKKNDFIWWRIWTPSLSH